MQKVKVKGHLVQKIDWKQTDGWTEAIALPNSLMRSITSQHFVEIAEMDPAVFLT